jgi:Tfp pilus assembly protein PilN
MIKINLLKRRKSAGLAAAGGGQKIFGIDISKLGGLGGTSLDVNSLKDIDWKKSPLVRAALAFVAIYLIQGEIASMKQQLLAEEDAKIAAVQGEIDEVAKKLGKVRGFEPLKLQLERDEQSIQTKLTIINSLLENRDAPIKMLRQISQIIPEEAWLNHLAIREGRMTINGGATNYNLVSDFMRNLSESSLFTGINISQVNETEQDGVKFQTFDITAETRGM